MTTKRKPSKKRYSPEYGWAVYGNDGLGLIYYTLQSERLGAKQIMENHAAESWDYYKAQGYTIQKVKITVLP